MIINETLKKEIEAKLLPKVVKITWIDTTTYPDGYYTHEELEELTATYSEEIGFLIRETEEDYTICSSIIERNLHKRITVIPKCCVIGYRLYESCNIPTDLEELEEEKEEVIGTKTYQID